MLHVLVSENRLFSEILKKKKKVWNKKLVIWKKKGEKRRKEWAAASVVD